MRIEGSIASVSWIPSEAVTGAYKVPFSVGLAQYDSPPPDPLGDIEALVREGRCRFCNDLRAFIDVEDGEIVGHGLVGDGFVGSTTLHFGRAEMTFAPFVFPTLRANPQVTRDSVTFTQTCGARTGIAAPRPVKRPPYFQLVAPTAWTTLQLTLHVDGRCRGKLVGASPFPRHWIYDHQGKLFQKSSFIDFKSWSDKHFGDYTPWGDSDSPALVSAVESGLERELADAILGTGAHAQVRSFAAGAKLCEQGEVGNELFLLLDGMLEVLIDGQRVAEVGPGAVVGERALLGAGRRTASLRAVTRCKVACVTGDTLDRTSLEQLAGVRKSEPAPG